MQGLGGKNLPNGRIETAPFGGALFLSAFLLCVLEPKLAKSNHVGSRQDLDLAILDEARGSLVEAAQLVLGIERS
jgi:hypothetical protein